VSRERNRKARRTGSLGKFGFSKSLPETSYLPVFLFSFFTDSWRALRL
jgi:hypothetical protein